MKVMETATFKYAELSDDIPEPIEADEYPTPNMMRGSVMEKTMYAAIRRCADDGHEWIDTDTLSYLLDCSQQSVTRTAEKIPLWHENNPVIRYAKIRLNEEAD